MGASRICLHRASLKIQLRSLSSGKTSNKDQQSSTFSRMYGWQCAVDRTLRWQRASVSQSHILHYYALFRTVLSSAFQGLGPQAVSPYLTQKSLTGTLKIPMSAFFNQVTTASKQLLPQGLCVVRRYAELQQ